MRAGLALALCLAAAAPAAASEARLAVGGSGEIYRAQTGRLGDLIASTAAASAGNAAMVIDIARVGEATQRILVPGTAGPEVEQAPFVLYQEALDTVFLIWQAQVNFLNSQFFLASYSAGKWSDPIALTTEIWTVKTPPQIAVTTDTYTTVDDAGKPTRHRRTIVHTLWWERGGYGDRTVYSPVVLIDGAYIGWNPLQVLDSLDPTVETAASAPPASLTTAPVVAAGANRKAVILSFVNPVSGRLLNIEVETLDWELTELAAETRANVLANGPGTELKSILDGARAHILVSGGTWYNRRFLNSLATEVVNRLQDIAKNSPAGGMKALGDGARAHILVAGVDLSGHALVDSKPIKSIAIAPDADNAPYVLLQIRLASILSIPQVPTSTPISIVASEDGTASIVAWQDAAERLSFRESIPNGWSSVRSFALDGSLSRERALRMLADRLSDR
jgi:hypothetical protein